MNKKKSHPVLNDMTWNSSMNYSQYMYPQWTLYMSKYIIFCLEMQILQRLAAILWVSKGYNVKYTHFEQDPNPSPLFAVCPWASIQLTSTVLDNNLGFLLFPNFANCRSQASLDSHSFSLTPFLITCSRALLLSLNSVNDSTVLCFYPCCSVAMF